MTLLSILPFALFGVLFAGVPLVMWRSASRAARDRWLPRPGSVARVNRGAFRDAHVRGLVAAGPPAVVHAAALGCWCLGAAFLPGLLVGLFCLLFWGLGLAFIPGLVLAWRLFFLGAPLLRGEPGAAARAIETARFVRWLNYVVLWVCAVATAYLCDAWGRHAMGYDRFVDLLGLTLSVAFYACVSLAHAWVLVRAAAAIDAELDRRAAGPS